MTPRNTEEAARKAKIAERKKKWHAANREKISATQKKWHAANPEKAAAYQKKYSEANPEQAAASQKKWREDNPEQDAARSKKWREANPEASRAGRLRRRARMRGAAGWSYTTEAHIAARWEAFGGRCWMCGGEATATDHVKPISKGGAHWPSNLRPSCTGCNLSKQAKWPYPTTTNQETRYETD